jgi:hypothetical protein
MTSSPIGFLKVKLELLQRHPSLNYFDILSEVYIQNALKQLGIATNR